MHVKKSINLVLNCEYSGVSGPRVQLDQLESLTENACPKLRRSEQTSQAD
jgi:hypothetical protein